ncbi:MAG: nitrilase [Sulfurimonas sp. RIFOXYD12_FULL_33_39]|uniref:carbon-nitrogen hydrolase family protein n=1 Tax=Sulfurimonas sp. RIFOXYD2_FULL_34_21 TaxID=1802261 RepID=UPI0008AE5461|nr:carbon-nitrogen hydrolase family protein [Sulfurimonas sp. RIFOXYD2_FULL_34_21]OHE05104.1 MAG: nitrilase [Sulfurimonas sp. RIFCSPLOWO2_12_FULL_34_6]OHE10924.1 MAG: nitrilase [Sulfurimonas sp. RIFOXYD12_FULL_33_39]OHE13306.1 MAG: nitrilase [Sulfurimonas sp. RIFOXYD2_FULL_34_21]
MSKGGYKLCSLLFDTTGDYNDNLQTLLDLVAKTSQKSLIVAPEVCLTGFDYENYDKAVQFSHVADIELKKASLGKIIILTMLEKNGNEVFNFAKIFYNGEIVFKRAKAKLFRFGNEHKYMSEGSGEDVKIVEVDGIKIGILICFELRFKEFWQKLEGCDVIAVPSWWGVLRTEHFRVITQTLAIINQCYVVASDSQNDECTKMSGIIRPHGEDERNGDRTLLEIPYNKKEIITMRRYMDVGIG